MSQALYKHSRHNLLSYMYRTFHNCIVVACTILIHFSTENFPYCRRIPPRGVHREMVGQLGQRQHLLQRHLPRDQPRLQEYCATRCRGHHQGGGHQSPPLRRGQLALDRDPGLVRSLYSSRANLTISCRDVLNPIQCM